MSEKEINTPISIRLNQAEGIENAWFWVEFLTVALLIITAGFYYWDQGFKMPKILLFCLLGFATWTDIRYGIIPNILIAIGGVTGILFFFYGQLNWMESVSSGLGLFALFLFVRWLSTRFLHKPGFGMGDVKLFAVLGLLLGYNALWVTYLTLMIAGLWAITGLALGSINRGDQIPIAPFITVAFLLCIFLITWSTFLGWWI